LKMIDMTGQNFKKIEIHQEPKTPPSRPFRRTTNYCSSLIRLERDKDEACGFWGSDIMTDLVRTLGQN